MAKIIIMLLRQSKGRGERKRCKYADVVYLSTGGSDCVLTAHDTPSQLALLVLRAGVRRQPIFVPRAAHVLADDRTGILLARALCGLAEQVLPAGVGLVDVEKPAEGIG